MGYDEALVRVAAAYPFGGIDSPDAASLSYDSLALSDGAACEVKTARGAVIRFGEGVMALGRGGKLTAEGPNCMIAVGANTTFDGTAIQVTGKGSIVVIGAGCRLRGVRIQVRRENSIVVIGANATWESGVILSESGNIVALGNDCMVSNGVILRTSDGHTIFDAKTKQPINDSADVLVGHHVWLGNSCRVNKGTRIGSGAVVGQCAVAAGALEANSIYAGIPARQVRSGIVWSRTNDYENIPPEFLI